MVDVPDFDAVYRADNDPWRVRGSFYERRKLEIVLACLDRPSYDAAWDPACGVGELAARLASRSSRVLATDASGEAVGITRARVAGLTGITVAHQALPTPAPADWLGADSSTGGADSSTGRADSSTGGADAGLDLVIISEFLYYLSPADRTASLTMIDSAVAEHAELVSLHWRYKPHDAYLSGADVQVEIGDHLETAGWSQILQHHDRDFVLQSFTRGDR